MKVDIAGVLVDNITNKQTIEAILQICRPARRTCPGEAGGSAKSEYIVTPYSEFVVFASRDENYRKILNGAALSLPDGIGILWAAKYLSLPLKGQSLEVKSLQAFWQLAYTLCAIVFHPRYIRSIISEQVTGRRLIWEIAKLASDRNYSLSLLGGEDAVAAQTAHELKKRFPALKIKLALSGNFPFDGRIVDEITATNSDILLIAYSPPKQEKWIAENLQKLNVKVAMGLGGTFDYIAGRRPKSPKFLHYIGLEWLWRLVTQPWRLKRIWNAVPVFIWKVYKYKLEFPSPFRGATKGGVGKAT